LRKTEKAQQVFLVLKILKRKHWLYKVQLLVCFKNFQNQKNRFFSFSSIAKQKGFLLPEDFIVDVEHFQQVMKDDKQE